MEIDAALIREAASPAEGHAASGVLPDETIYAGPREGVAAESPAGLQIPDAFRVQIVLKYDSLGYGPATRMPSDPLHT